MTKVDSIFNGKEKKIFVTDNNQDNVIILFKDITTAFGNIKRARFAGKGRLCCAISSILLKYLNDNGVQTHFIKQTEEDEQLCRRIEIIPIEFVVRNYAAGTMAERLGLEEGLKLPNVVVDLNFNCDSLGDPMVNEDELTALGIVTAAELKGMRRTVLKVNTLLIDIFKRASIKLVDFKMEFGRASDGNIIISDEISPDTCRLWDMETNDKLDKDLFRHDLGDICEAYKKVLERLQTIKES